MVDCKELRNQLLKEIEEEKGFSWRKLVKIIKLNSLYNNEGI
jgi:hypothetical protein